MTTRKALYGDASVTAWGRSDAPGYFTIMFDKDPGFGPMTMTRIHESQLTFTDTEVSAA